MLRFHEASSAVDRVGSRGLGVCASCADGAVADADGGDTRIGAECLGEAGAGTDSGAGGLRI